MAGDDKPEFKNLDRKYTHGAHQLGLNGRRTNPAEVGVHREGLIKGVNQYSHRGSGDGKAPPKADERGIRSEI